MSASLTFMGAAQNVTGSRHLLEVDGLRVLVDCGLYQERELRARNWDVSPLSPRDLDAVLLTHAHLDHCGILPKLVREGFRGPVYCTAATAEIAQLMLLDAAHLQEEDADFKRRRHQREGHRGPYPEVPLYTVADARQSFSHFSTVRYGQRFQVGDGIEATFFDAGHVLGSSMVLVKVRANGANRTVLFSGDIGRWDHPILNDPTLFEEADYVLMESTYGDSLHQDPQSIDDMLAEVVNSTRQAGGNIVIPSFALERSQDLLYYLNRLLKADRIPHLMVFVDSPLATDITQVYQRHPELLDEEMTELLGRGQSPFDFPGLTMVTSAGASKAINHISGTVIIIAGSGMCTGGRIKHHLVNNISRPGSAILFVGYQAVDTLGRQILDGAPVVRILGQMYEVRARIVQIHGFSAHADREELLRWVSAIRKAPRGLFVVHGEPTAARSFAGLLKERLGWQAIVPAYRDRADLA